MSPIGDKILLPENEGQGRELAAMLVEMRPEALRLAFAKAGGDQAVTRHGPTGQRFEERQCSSRRADTDWPARHERYEHSEVGQHRFSLRGDRTLDRG